MPRRVGTRWIVLTQIGTVDSGHGSLGKAVTLPGAPKAPGNWPSWSWPPLRTAEELVKALLAVISGEVPDLPGVQKEQVVRVSDRLKAVEILMDRAFGKAPQHLELGGAGASKWDDVLESWTDEDMMAVVRLRDQLRSGVIEVEGKVLEDQ